MEASEIKNVLRKRILRLRQKRGWSQGDLGEQLGLSIPAVSKLENGITDCDMQRLRQFAEVFEVTLQDLITDGSEQEHMNGNGEFERLRALISKREVEIIALQAKLIGLYEELDLRRK